MDEDSIKLALTEEEYKVLREKGTEAPFTGKYWNTKEKGIYTCKVCGQKLFASDTKFDSGTGWPSFYDAVQGSVEFVHDDDYGMHRTEVICSKCKSHLGHVFDGVSNTPTGKYFCMNSACFDLKSDEEGGSDAEKDGGSVEEDVASTEEKTSELEGGSK